MLGVGVDLISDGLIKLTVQVAKPGEMKSGAEGGAGGGGADPVSVMTSQGRTPFEAVRNMTTISSKRLFFSHNQVLIFGESLAKHGVDEVIDFFERDPELRLEVPILIAKGSAEDILKIPGNMEKITALEINKSVETVEFSARAGMVEFYDFLRNYFKKGYSPVAPLIEKTTVAGRDQYKIAGMAVFKDDRLVGILNDHETRGFLWITGKVKSGIIALKSRKLQDSWVSLEIKNAKSKTGVKIKEGMPQIEVAIQETSSLGEVTGPFAINAADKLKMLEKEQDKQIKSDAESALNKALKILKTDIFGFGQEFYRSYPKQWAAVEDSWEQKLPSLKVRLKIKSNIEITGEKTNSTTAAKKEN